MAGTGIEISMSVDFPTSEIFAEVKEVLQQEIEPQLTSAMNSVAADAKNSLMRHVQEDVYDKWEPTVYERRYTGSGGLMSMYASFHESVSSTRLMLEYEPSGQQPQWEHPKDGDALISRIESGRGYEWRKHPGPRPFWTNFVDEMVNQGFADAFDRAMFEQFGLEYEGGTVVEREPNDGVYDNG